MLSFLKGKNCLNFYWIIIKVTPSVKSSICWEKGLIRE